MLEKTSKYKFLSNIIAGKTRKIENQKFFSRTSLPWRQKDAMFKCLLERCMGRQIQVGQAKRDQLQNGSQADNPTAPNPPGFGIQNAEQETG